MIRRLFITAAAMAVATAATVSTPVLAAPAPVTLTNVSYDPTRELYQAVNPAFALWWKHRTGQDVSFRMSHGGSGAQSRAILDGLDADVATLGLAYDIDVLADKGKLLAENWQSALPQNSSPYTSTIVFLVRKGNPKGIHDWGDLVKPGVQVITPNPKTSGGGRWNFIAAWAWARRNAGGDAGARNFEKQLYSHVPVLDSGARGSTTTFAERGIGDVLLAWENEAYLAVNKLGPDKFDIVTPKLSMLAEPPVAVLTANTDRHGTTLVSAAYLRFLYSPWAQGIIAQNYYRPRDPVVAAKYASKFPKVNLLAVDKEFGGWRKAQHQFFDDGAIYDQISAH